MDETTHALLPDHMATNGYPPVDSEPDTLVPVTRLAVADALFSSQGIAKIKATRRGKPIMLEIPIKSVDLDAVQQKVKALKPSQKLASKRDMIDGKWVTVHDPYNPEFLEKMDAYNTALANTWILMALEIDVVDAGGDVVWSADNTIAFYEQAVRALKAMGLVSNQLTALLHAVRHLTEIAEEDLEGN